MLLTLPAVAIAADPPEQTRRFIVADSSQKRLAIIAEDGTTEWEYSIGPLHDFQLLPNGHLLLQDNWTHVIEVDLKTKEVVWEYDATKQEGALGRRIEVHAFQRLKDGRTMIAESGRARFVMVDSDGQITHVIPMKLEAPHPHRDTRLARVLKNGNILACHEGDGAVREYSPTGRVVWEYKVPLFGRQRARGHGVDAFGNQCFHAIRLKNGHTLIATGNGHSVIEVTAAGQDVWSIHQNDLPGIQLAWVTSLQQLPNGNVLIGNCHAGPNNPQVIEVNRQKEVVWKFHDFERFGNATTTSRILSVNGKSLPNPLPF